MRHNKAQALGLLSLGILIGLVFMLFFSVQRIQYN